MDARLVLVEALRRRIAAHADIHPVRSAAALGEIQQHQVDVATAAAGGVEGEPPFVDRWQALDVAHGEPLGNRRRRAAPQRLERRLDARRKLPAHPQLVYAVRPGSARRVRQRGAQLRLDALLRQAGERTRRRRQRLIERARGAHSGAGRLPAFARAEISHMLPPIAIATGTISTACAGETMLAMAALIGPVDMNSSSSATTTAG